GRRGPCAFVLVSPAPKKTRRAGIFPTTPWSSLSASLARATFGVGLRHLLSTRGQVAPFWRGLVPSAGEASNIGRAGFGRIHRRYEHRPVYNRKARVVSVCDHASPSARLGRGKRRCTERDRRGPRWQHTWCRWWVRCRQARPRRRRNVVEVS